MIKTILLIIIPVLLCAHQTVENLDIEKFMGRWYVISLIPNWIEKNATNSYDDYLLNDDGTIDITYNAIQNNSKKQIKQKGIIENPENPAKWEIQFIKPWVPFFKAPYEVIILDTNYNYMVVGYPDNTFGWIMSRTTYLNDTTYEDILNELEFKFGYSKDKFKKVIHDN
tara:strand:+ start:1143 stop:1649 length:507 start_codon:yes stop_codon:yes gene_type:complete